VVMFPTSAVFSAYGIVASNVVHSLELSRRMRFPFDVDAVNGVFGELESRLTAKMQDAGFKDENVTLVRTLKMRYGLQVHEIRVPVEREQYDGKKLKIISDDFEKRYEEIYGKDTGYSEAGIDIISFEVEAIGKIIGPKAKKYKPGGKDASGAVRTKRDVYFRSAGGFVRTNIYEYGKLKPKNIIEGPAIIEVPTTTAVILPGQTARVDDYMNIII
ncbi:MAG: hypothetical protein Q7J12_00875, partial [Syntrophales bacterium]|nr:hypothetical protein [Syntrophales bacterium]